MTCKLPKVSQSDQSIPDETIRSRLEIEKLQVEIGNLKNRWWKPAAIQATPAFLLVVATVLIARFSGVLDARREFLAAQHERLQTQTTLLREEEKSRQIELESLKHQLAIAKGELQGFRDEPEAMTSIRRLIPFAMIGFCDEELGLGIELSTLNLFAIRGTNNPPTALSNLSTALHEMEKLKNLRSLTIRNLLISKAELKQIGALKNLRSIQLENNGLTDDVMQSFPTLPLLTDLTFLYQDVSYAEAFLSLRKLKRVIVDEVPMSDKGILFLEYSNTTLEHVSLGNSAVTDDGMTSLENCPNLKFLYLAGSRVTEKGIRTVGSNDALSQVYVGASQVNQEAIARLQTNRLRVEVVTSK
jgi:Leucine-rich repeat (LRR) protein